MTSSPIRLAARAFAVIATLMIVGTVRAEAQDSVNWNAYIKSEQRRATGTRFPRTPTRAGSSSSSTAPAVMASMASAHPSRRR